MAGKVRIGIIGLGFMGSTHFRIHKENSKAEIKAVADVDPAKIKGDWSRIVGNIGNIDNSIPVDMTGIHAYTDGLELINDPEVDMVDICVPTFLHKKYALAALQAGKHVMCEKPIGRTKAEAREIVSAARLAKGNFMAGMCIRFWPEYRHAYELYKSGKIGKLLTATFKRVSPNISGHAWQNWFMKAENSGGALLDLHLHDTDAIRYFFGRPAAVQSFGKIGIRTDKGIDHVITRYAFKDGSLVAAEGSWSPAKGTPFEMSFQIVCEKATIRLSETGYKVIYEDGKVEQPQVASPELPTGWHVELNYFINCILEKKKPDMFMSFEEMEDSISIVEAEERSVLSGKEVAVEY